jgi:hypothetical protein
MDAVLCAPLPVGPTAGVTACPKAAVTEAAAAANVANKRKSRRRIKPSPYKDQQLTAIKAACKRTTPEYLTSRPPFRNAIPESIRVSNPSTARPLNPAPQHPYLFANPTPIKFPSGLANLSPTRLPESSIAFFSFDARHHAPSPGAMVKVKPCGCCATLTPLVVVARLARRLRGKCRFCPTKGKARLLQMAEVRRPLATTKTTDSAPPSKPRIE